MSTSSRARQRSATSANPAHGTIADPDNAQLAAGELEEGVDARAAHPDVVGMEEHDAIVGGEAELAQHGIAHPSSPASASRSS